LEKVTNLQWTCRKMASLSKTKDDGMRIYYYFIRREREIYWYIFEM